MSSIWAINNAPMGRGIIRDSIVFAFGRVVFQGNFRGLVGFKGAASELFNTDLGFSDLLFDEA